MKMKHVLGPVLLLVLAFSISAGEPIWHENFEVATEQAKTTGKYIFLNFSGSDWCGWCIKLDDEVLKQEVFRQFAAEHLILMLADFPRTTQQDPQVAQQNQALAKKYGVRGFPTVLILDPSGSLVEQTGYLRGGASAYVKHVREIINKNESKKKS